jgi:adenylate kinase family enzyme
MPRINVVGTSCSGKTTLARALAGALDVPHIELDALFWDRDWTPVPGPMFRDRLGRALAGEDWVADGGYAAVRDITWARVETIVWLDYPLRTVLGRWARRTVARLRSHEEVWPGTGNRERIRHILRRDSLLWWILSTHHRRRRSHRAAIAAAQNVRWVRLRTPAEADAWLAGVQAGGPLTTAGAIASAQKP